MNTKILFDQFETLTEAPNGVTKLRELILQLAVQGKLVPQDPNDEPASVLLGKIKAEKARLIKKGKLKKGKPLEPIRPEEVPHPLPESWKWVRLSDVFDVRDGTHDTPKYVDVGIPLVTSKNIYNGWLDFSNIKYISREDHEMISMRSKVDKNDILFAMIGSIGNPVIVDTDQEFSIKNVALFKYYSLQYSAPEFLNYFLSQAAEEMCYRASGGVQSFVSLKYLRSYPFPLAPLEEQKRIVAKVDQLMALCDKLEERQSKKRETKLKLNRASLNRLTTSGKEDLTTNWRNLRDSFTLIYDTPETIPELRRAVLQLAVQGKLVPQDLKNEPASALLEKIKSEKEHLIKEGKLKKFKPIAPIEPDEIPFELPHSWEWVRLGNLGDIYRGVSYQKNVVSENPAPDYVPLLRAHNINNINGTVNYEKLVYIPKNLVNSEQYIRQHDILICMSSGSKDLVGKTAIAQKDYDGAFGAFCGLIRIDPKTSREYISIFLCSPLYRESISEASKGIGINNLTKGMLENTKIPLPPLEEQKRIVAKVDQLMVLCDELEHKLEKSTTQTQKLLESIVCNLV